MAKHSPLPWRVYDDINVMSAEPYPYGLVAECDMGITGELDKPALWRANAELIVRAVNAHDELVAVLEDIESGVWATPESGVESYQICMSVTAMDRLRTALAKARGES